MISFTVDIANSAEYDVAFLMSWARSYCSAYFWPYFMLTTFWLFAFYFKEPDCDVNCAAGKGAEVNLVAATRQRILQLLSSIGIVELNEFESIYRDLFGDNYSCPMGKSHVLKTCLRQHFIDDISLIGKNVEKKICLKQNTTTTQIRENIQETSNNLVCTLLFKWHYNCDSYKFLRFIVVNL